MYSYVAIGSYYKVFLYVNRVRVLKLSVLSLVIWQPDGHPKISLTSVLAPWSIINCPYACHSVKGTRRASFQHPLVGRLCQSRHINFQNRETRCLPNNLVAGCIARPPLDLNWSLILALPPTRKLSKVSLYKMSNTHYDVLIVGRLCPCSCTVNTSALETS